MTEQPTSNDEKVVQRSGRRRSLVIGGEITFVILVAFVFVLALMGMLTLAFPESTSLTNLYSDWIGSVRGTGGSATDPRLADPDTIQDDGIAVLERIHRRVKDRPVHAVSWINSRGGERLDDGHTVQTYARATAQIRFNEGTEAWLGENSLVVIRRPEVRTDDRRRAALILLGGRVRGKISRRVGGGEQLEISTPGATAKILSTDQQPAEFQLSLNPDQSTTLAVLSGSAEIESAGSMRVVEANEQLTVLPDRPPGAARSIPDAPRPTAPAPDAVVLYGPIAPQVDFYWSRSPGVDGYLFEIASDPGFEQLVHQARLVEPRFVHGKLADGEYYWRVRGSLGAGDTKSSSPRKLKIVHDTEPPEVALDFPQEIVATAKLTLRGQTEPGASVIIDGFTLTADDTGQFEYTLSLRTGPNLVQVEVEDAAGNVTYQSEYVHAKL